MCFLSSIYLNDQNVLGVAYLLYSSRRNAACRSRLTGSAARKVPTDNRYGAASRPSPSSDPPRGAVGTQTAAGFRYNAAPGIW